MILTNLSPFFESLGIYAYGFDFVRYLRIQKLRSVIDIAESMQLIGVIDTTESDSATEKKKMQFQKIIGTVFSFLKLIMTCDSWV